MQEEIKEMAKIIYAATLKECSYNHDYHCGDCCEYRRIAQIYGVSCQAVVGASTLYKAGYRKITNGEGK